MHSINFIKNLKENLWNIEKSGGNYSFHVSPNQQLLTKLRKFVFDEVKNIGLTFEERNRQIQSFIDDILDRQRFQRRIKYCVVKLSEFDFNENNYYEYISTALGNILEFIKVDSNFSWHRYSTKKVENSIEQLIVKELINCFASWYFPEDICIYDFLSEHNLIIWNNEETKWVLTNIGRYSSQLSVFELILFLSALEIVFGSSENWQYLNKEILNNLIHGNKSEQQRLRHRRLPQSLRLFGIIDSSRDPEKLTDVGYRILKKVDTLFTELSEIAYLLIESEISGFQIRTSNETIKQINISINSNLLSKDNKTSIENALKLYSQGNFLDCLRLFYSNIESILNTQLKKIGEKPDSYSGMKTKINKLEKESMISSKLGTWLEVITSRNKILHGNISENDSNVLKPLLDIVGSFWNLLIMELEQKNS